MAADLSRQSESMRFIIDRFEDDYAVLEDEQMNAVTIPRSLIDESAKEGSYVKLSGQSYVSDPSLTDIEKEDRERVVSKFNKLKKK